MLAIYKKEICAYFNSMVGCVFLAFFLAIIGIYTWAYNFAGGMGNFEITLNSVAFLFVILIPILTMRIVAEENRQKTDQLLYTAPISIGKIILGKYLAVLTLFLIGCAVISVYPLILSRYGEVRLGLAYGGIIGFILLGAAYIAIGMFISSLTESQVISAVVSFLVLLLTYLIGGISTMFPAVDTAQWIILAFVFLLIVFVFYYMMRNIIVVGIIGVVGEGAMLALYLAKPSAYEGLVPKICEWLAISGKFQNFAMGIIDYSAVVYYLSIVFLFIFLTIQIIRKKRFN